MKHSSDPTGRLSVLPACPAWCEEPQRHEHTEECLGRPNVVTGLYRNHRRELGTVLSHIWKGPRQGNVAIAYTVELWMTEKAQPQDPTMYAYERPEVVLYEELPGLFSPAQGMQQMNADEAESLVELLTIGAKACRDIEAGVAPTGLQA